MQKDIFNDWREQICYPTEYSKEDEIADYKNRLQLVINFINYYRHEEDAEGLRMIFYDLKNLEEQTLRYIEYLENCICVGRE
jgi:hypothetical protein